jgi:hypothetical protein
MSSIEEKRNGKPLGMNTLGINGILSVETIQIVY